MDFLLRRVSSRLAIIEMCHADETETSHWNLALTLLNHSIYYCTLTTNILLTSQPQTYHKKKNYRFGRVLGHGSFGEVKEAIWTSNNNTPVAIKVILKKSIRGQPQLIYDEIDVLKGLDHPNIGERASLSSHTLWMLCWLIQTFLSVPFFPCRNDIIIITATFHVSLTVALWALPAFVWYANTIPHWFMLCYALVSQEW